MSLYNLRSTELDGTYHITKFTSDLNVESSYTVSAKECDCPAGFRPSCRHRQMLSVLLCIVDDSLFFDYETKQYFDVDGVVVHEPHPAATAVPSVSIASYRELGPDEDIAKEFDKLIHGSIEPAPKAAQASAISDADEAFVRPLRRRV